MYVYYLTPVFVTLFEEDQWPDNALEYARGFFGSTSREDIDTAVADNARLKEELRVLEARVADAEKRLELLD
jgi:hypothetical protein